MADTSSDASGGTLNSLASLFGSIGVLGNTFLSNWLGSSSNKKAQKRAYNYWKSSLLEGPSLTRQGLESAGYNPLLALGSVGGQSFSANSAPSFAPVGDVVGGAEAGARLGNLLLRGIKLDNEKKELENKNLKSDLDTKEVQRLQMEANESLLQSQTERSDLAYGRDVVDTLTGIAGTASSLYSAKAMRDIARSPSETVTTIHHGDKTKPTEIIKTKGVPSVDSSAKGSSRSVLPNVGSSAKSAGRIAKEIAQDIVFGAALPITLIGGTSAAVDHAFGDDSFYKRVHKKSKELHKKARPNIPRRVLLH